MYDKMKQLMEVRRQAEQLKKELDAAVVESNNVRGIKVIVNGSQVLLSLNIDDELLSAGNKNRLENDLLRAINDALKKSQDFAAQKMKAMTGLNIPGM